MKLVKLSLVAALAVGSFSALEAKPLEDAIKNVDINGLLRYRYDSSSYKDRDGIKNLTAGANAVNDKANGSQTHRYRAFLGTKFDVGDGFKIFGQLMYNNDANAGYAGGMGTQTKSPVVLKQAYLEYDVGGASFTLGRQELGTIWTEDLTGMVAKAFFTPVKGLTIAAFAVDSIEGATTNGAYQVGDTDATNLQVYFGSAGAPLTQRLYKENMYGVAVLAKFAGLDAQIWGNHWDKTATLYAINLQYTLNLGDKNSGNSIGIKATYLGNVIDGMLQTAVKKAVDSQEDQIADGNLGDVRVTAKFAGLDAQLGGIYFGSKDKFSVNTLEGLSGIGANAIGREIFYQKGSWLPLAYGQSLYGYVGVGYTLPASVRLGVQGVFGETSNDKVKDTAADGIGKKMELVGEVSYKVNTNLDFLLWYSYLSAKDENGKAKDGAIGEYSEVKTVKNSVRFQAIYKFK